MNFMNWNSKLQTVAAFLSCLLSTLCVGDINSGCPSWGCLPCGSFSLSSDIPSNGQVKWSTMITGQVERSTTKRYGMTDSTMRGCVSDQQTVVCATQSGYVSIDPSTGKKLWNYTTETGPYLPIMDIYGDVIGMDQTNMYYVGADGKPKQPIGVAILKPSFSLMVGNDSIMIIAATTNKTAQIVTYLTAGIVDAAIPLTGSINRVNGTFIPCSQPIIAGSRAYLVSYFYPDSLDDQEAVEVSGMMRLYAIDLLHQMAPRIRIAWYFNFGRWSQYSNWKESGLEPIVTYFRGAVYVNMPGSLFTNYRDERKGHNPRQPYPGVMWAVQDTGSEGKQLFRTSSLYGPMAVFDTYDSPLRGQERLKMKKDSESHAVWIMNHSPAMLVGHDALNGSVVNVTGLETIFQHLSGWITSRLSITRSHNAPDTDVLVFGMTDDKNLARLVAIEISSDGAAKLRMNVVVGKPTSENNTMLVEGQIINVALSYMDQTTVTWKLGLVAMVTEMGPSTSNTSAVAVF